MQAIPTLLWRAGRPYAALRRAGDPVRMIHHLGLGVWAFLASPAAGLVASARGLLAHVVFAVSNASAKWSGAMRKAGARPPT